MPKSLRQFTRFRSNSFCLIESESSLVKAVFIDYSQMGALLRLEKRLASRKHLALIYPNEKADFVKMAGYSIHGLEKNGLYYLGVQFIALISR